MKRRIGLAWAAGLFLGMGCAAPVAAPPTGAASPPLATSSEFLPVASAPEAPEAPEAEPALAPPPPGTVVLHVGDSFVHAGLTQRLEHHFEDLSVRYVVRADASTNSLDWSRRMPAVVAQSDPDLVIVTLGANEIGTSFLGAEARAIRRLVSAIGDRPCVWTTPPLWREESGFFDTLQANVAPCRFFETDRQVGAFLPRRPDRVHPTDESGARWADALFQFLMDQRTGDGEHPWSLLDPPRDELQPRGRRRPLPAASR